MAEKRKLLNEIDKCYKKIEEGFEIFDDIMAKMTEANSDNQREKFQDDLKKEIKKLQRLRDQIKGWQNSSEIKDKDSLSKFRKLIEQRMEIFKDVERENKTKPHSKQGLSAEDKLDPREKEKCETIEWLNCQIRRIQDEIDRTESKLETLSTAETGKKRGKKEDLKKNDKEKVEELRKHLDRVKFHLLNLEVCMRLINNEKLEIKDVLSKLKEPLEMYIDALDPDNDDDPESLDPEDIYEELDFGTYLSQLGGVSMSNPEEDKMGNNDNGSHKSSSSPTPDAWSLQRHQNGEAEGQDKQQANQTTSTTTTTRSASESASSHKSVVSVGASSIASLKLTRLGSQVSNTSSLSSPLPQTPPALSGIPQTPPALPAGIPYNSVAAGKLHTPPVQTSSQQQNPMINSTQPANSTGPFATTISPVTTACANAISPSIPLSLTQAKDDQLAKQLEETNSVSTTSSTETAHVELFQIDLPSASTVSKTPIPSEENISSATTSSSPAPIGADLLPTSLGPKTIESLSSSLSRNETTTQREKEQHEKQQENIMTEFHNKSNVNANNINSSLISQMFVQMEQQQQRNKEPQEATIPAWLGASPLGMVAASDELNYQLQMLEATISRCPVQMDSEKPRSYLPKMPCQTPHYYPQAPLPNADTLEYYLRLSVETLFFTFYYMEGSRAQLLAAKALKKLSWRFHTKYLMWFQRHEEPKQITDDYEQGTYVYFDFEKWVQRKKEQFTFEYKYLEDKDFE